MYCSQCGKKVMETMLFCPFCGSPIVIPEQEEKEQKEVTGQRIDSPRIDVITEAVGEKKPNPTQSNMAEEKEIAFVPLDMEHMWDKPEEKPEVSQEKEISETLNRQLQEEPVRLQGRTPDLSAARPHGAPKIASHKKKKADTYVPQREFDPDDIFFDGEDEADFEDYEDDFEYEERERGGFFIRHIRGFVSLIMFAVVAAVVLGWAFSASGQQALARTGLAWKPEIYAEVALEAYQNGSYALAGSYYAEALERDAGSYEYANSAGVAYYNANDTLNAEAFAKKAIDINPVRREAYEILLRLYPAAESRPMEIQAILQKGYQLTGDEALNPGQ